MYPARLRRILIFFCFAVLMASARADDAPSWLQAAAKTPLPPHTDRDDVAILYHQTNVTVQDDGQLSFSHKIAYKILRPGGRPAAMLQVFFDSETKVTYLRGWTITPTGRIFEAKDKDIIERDAFSGGTLYADDREKMLLPPEADVGAVVGYEYEKLGRPYLFQYAWYFQDRYPVARAVFSLHLPPSWEYKAAWVNYSGTEPLTSGADVTWSVANVPGIEEEPSMPSYRAVAGRLQVTLFSPQANFRDRAHLAWSEMGTWYGRLVSDRRVPTPTMQAKVAELTAGKNTTLEKVRALANFVQRDIRYVAIEIGIGGFRPHTAAEIFGSRYGDCKDKATLLSTMLKQIGVDSDYVIIQTKRGIVTQDAPVADLFNHVVLAIAMPGDVKETFPATVDTKAGRLLIFDPTDEMTPFGTLPPYLEDNYGLLVTASGGELIHLPMFAAELNQLRRTGKLTLGADGSLTGEIEEVRTGAVARDERYRLQAMSPRERMQKMESFIGAFVGAASIQDYGVDNLEDPEKDLVTHYKFWSPKYGKVAGPLLLVRPRLFGDKTENVFSDRQRHYPFAFDAPTLQTDVYEYQLPPGFSVDELPEPTSATITLADYRSKIEQKGNVLRYERRYELKGVMLPASEETNLRKFYSNVTADERASAVLKRGN